MLDAITQNIRQQLIVLCTVHYITHIIIIIHLSDNNVLLCSPRAFKSYAGFVSCVTNNAEMRMDSSATLNQKDIKDNYLCFLPDLESIWMPSLLILRRAFWMNWGIDLVPSVYMLILCTTNTFETRTTPTWTPQDGLLLLVLLCILARLENVLWMRPPRDSILRTSTKTEKH